LGGEKRKVRDETDIRKVVSDCAIVKTNRKKE